MDETTLRQPRPAAASRALTAGEESTGASAAVRTRLLEEVRRLRRARRRSFVKMSVLSATLCAATATAVWHLATRDLRGRSPAAPQNQSPWPGGERATAFFPLIYSTVPMSGGRLVRLEVARQSATAFGVEIPESTGASASSVVLADVLVGEDGIARAVRFVRPVTGVAQKEGHR